MIIGEVRTFPESQLPSDIKEQAKKVIEEAAEVFSAVENLKEYHSSYAFPDSRGVMNECADVIMATCNLLSYLGIEDFSYMIKLCEERQEERGRYDLS